MTLLVENPCETRNTTSTCATVNYLTKRGLRSVNIGIDHIEVVSNRFIHLGKTRSDGYCVFIGKIQNVSEYLAEDSFNLVGCRLWLVLV